MRLFFIRHGETVDNVAGLYAGSRDSALTAHGVLQAQRLADHFAQQPFVAGHIFSSDLQRAAITAGLVCDAQRRAHGCLALDVVQVPEIREKDFGSGEGVKYGASKDGSPRQEHIGSESAEVMKARVDRFLDACLLPVVAAQLNSNSACIVVAHGIILSVLFKAFLARIPGAAISAASEAQIFGSHDAGVPILPSWSNTGYLDMLISPPKTRGFITSDAAAASAPFRVHINAVNCAAFDANQKSIDSFFGGSAHKRKASSSDSSSHKVRTTVSFKCTHPRGM
jgi:2,3-bisphosphoglycerate-dependent phosphoglycerate mutase